ncbi:MAG: hypothetical protein IPL06_04510 [Betaproteobacteria bacterium]|nr:hypothetical protein [Betaproteobacteria bacterium]
MDAESFLARLYADEAFREAFTAAPLEVARREGLDEREAGEFARMDLPGLALAAESYARKRSGRRGPRD